MKTYKFNTFNDFTSKKGDKQLLLECRLIEQAIFQGIPVPEVARDYDVSPAVIFHAMIYLDAVDKSLILEAINRKEEDEHQRP